MSVLLYCDATRNRNLSKRQFTRARLLCVSKKKENKSKIDSKCCCVIEFFCKQIY